MLTRVSQLLILIQLRTVLNELHQPAKRSPLDIKPEHLASINPPTTSPLLAALTKTTNDRHPKFIPIQHQYYIPHHFLVIPAHSNVHHSQIHTNIHHVNSANGRIPILTQTVLHSSSNISHPTQLLPILVPVHHNYYLHDLSVIPLRHPGNVVETMSRYRVEKRNDNYDNEEYSRNMFRSPIGGFGTGLHFGGHGAGHGYFV